MPQGDKKFVMEYKPTSPPFKVTPLMEMVAKNFTWRIYTNLPRSEFFEMVQRNREETNVGICHSHDFCDSNVYMAEAIEHVTGEVMDARKRRLTHLFECAWFLARRDWQNRDPDWLVAIRDFMRCPELQKSDVSLIARNAKRAGRDVLARYENEEHQL
jgi:hypothetical protein